MGLGTKMLRCGHKHYGVAKLTVGAINSNSTVAAIEPYTFESNSLGCIHFVSD